MKKLFILSFILFTSYVFPQCSANIGGEQASQPAVCTASNYQLVRNAMDNTGSEMHYRQVWALHYRDETSDLDSGDTQPAFNYITGGTCNVSNQRCYTMGGDTCNAYNTTNTTDNCKFVWLLEQIRSGIGEFAVIVGGQNVSDQIAADSIQTKMYNRFSATTACSSYFSPVIGDCGSGAGIPCIDNVTPSGANVIVTFHWAWPSDQAIVYTRDDEDALGPGNNCPKDSYGWNPTSRLNALQTIITGWEVFYAGSASSNPIPGVRTNWTPTDDTDSNRVQVGGRWYSTDTQATVVIPQSAGSYVFVGVAPVFDGPAGGGPGLREAIGNKSVRLHGVLSRSSAPIVPTPVTISSFTARYVDLQNVKIEWETATEADAAGFFLYRSIDGQNWAQVNSQMIPARGKGGAGAVYSYNDTVPKQRTYTKYYYKVVEITTNGERGAEAQTETTK